jgi:hypothetical protein
MLLTTTILYNVNTGHNIDALIDTSNVILDYANSIAHETQQLQLNVTSAITLLGPYETSLNTSFVALNDIHTQCQGVLDIVSGHESTIDPFTADLKYYNTLRYAIVYVVIMIFVVMISLLALVYILNAVGVTDTFQKFSLYISALVLVCGVVQMLLTVAMSDVCVDDGPKGWIDILSTRYALTEKPTIDYYIHPLMMLH